MKITIDTETHRVEISVRNKKELDFVYMKMAEFCQGAADEAAKIERHEHEASSKTCYNDSDITATDKSYPPGFVQLGQKADNKD